MTGADPTERLQSAAKELIAAARAVLDAADEFVDDPDRARDAVAGAGVFVTDLLDSLAHIAARSASARRGAGSGHSAGEPGSFGADESGAGDERFEADEPARGSGSRVTVAPGERLRRLRVVDIDDAVDG